MKSYIKTFEYANEKNYQSKKMVFVMNEDDTYIEGFEVKKLSLMERVLLHKLFSEHTVGEVSNPSKKADKIIGFNPDWIRAWRKYRKDRIVNNNRKDQVFTVEMPRVIRRAKSYKTRTVIDGLGRMSP